MDKKKIEELEAQIADLKKRWPAHSTPPGMMMQLDELEEALALAKKAAADEARPEGAVATDGGQGDKEQP